MPKYFPLLGLLPLWGLLACPAAAGDPGDNSAIVATWTGGSLSRTDYQNWLEFQGVEDSPEALRELVLLQTLATISREKDLDQDPRMRLEVEALDQRLLVPALRRDVLTRVKVGDQEVEALYRENPQAFQGPRKLRLRNLYKRLGAAPDAAEAVRERMGEIHRQLLEGADFETLARRESESQSRFRGGHLGYVDPDALPPAVGAVVRDLTPGQISPPVEHGDGMTIFLCDAIQAARTPTPDAVREKIRTQLLRRQGRQRWAEVEALLLAKGAPRLTPDSPETVLEMPDYRMSTEDLATLVAMRLDGKKPTDLDRSQREKLLRDWAQGVLNVRHAVELGLHQDPRIAAALRWQRLRLLANRELVRRVEARFQPPTEAESRAHFAAHPERYQELASYDLSLIHFRGEDDLDSGPESAPAERIAQAETVARRIETGELSFEEAARRYSIHPSAAKGGRIGWFPQRQAVAWGATGIHALRQLEPGQQSGLLHLDSGLWILHLHARREAQQLSFEDAREQIQQELGQQRVTALESALQEEHLQEIGLRIPSAAAPPRVLRWSTANEFENYGYHVYRGLQEDGPFERLTEEAIPGAGTTDLPQSYRFEDPTAEPGVDYYYYVESVSTSGQRKRLTPVRRVGEKEP